MQGITSYLIFLIDRENVPAKEGALAACIVIEGIVIFPICRPVRIISGIKPNTNRSGANVEQVVLVMKVSTN